LIKDNWLIYCLICSW